MRPICDRLVIATHNPGKLREIAAPGMVMSCSKDEGVLVGTYKPQILPPGRGVIVTRKLGQQLMQTAWLPGE